MAQRRYEQNPVTMGLPHSKVSLRLEIKRRLIGFTLSKDISGGFPAKTWHLTCGLAERSMREQVAIKTLEGWVLTSPDGMQLSAQASRRRIDALVAELEQRDGYLAGS